MPVSWLMSMQEAVGRFVPDGASVCMATALEALILFAAGHELIRQCRRSRVAAVVHEPFGAYPPPVQGYYGRGHDF